MELLWLPFSLATIFFYGVGQVLAKESRAGASSANYMLLFGGSIFAIWGVYWLALGEPSPHEASSWAKACIAAALSGEPDDIAATDAAVLAELPDDAHLRRWLTMAAQRVKFQGLPARLCWLGYGERARVGARFNDLVRRGEVKAPLVIGRDHLDAGSVASPNRETEAMKDGSDAIADWPILNALVNTACGASWVSVHHGGGVGIGYALHAGQVIVADGTPEAARRLECVLTADPATGIIRHADAGYEKAERIARERGVKIPG